MSENKHDARAKSRGLRRAIAVAGLAVGVCGITALFALGPGRSTQPGGAAGAGTGGAQHGTLDLHEVVKGDFEITTTASGDLRARNQVEIRSEMEQETTILEIVPEGSVVKKGSVLVRLNAESTQTRLNEEELSLETSRADLVAANEGYLIQESENDSSRRAAELKLALAELSLDQWRLGEVKSKEQELQHGYDTSEKDVVRLTDKVAKSRELKEAGFYSVDQLKQDELELDRAVAAFDKAKLSKEIYWQYEHPKALRQKTSDVEEARAEVDRVKRQNASRLVSKEAERKNKERALSIRQEKFDNLKKQLEAATIVAPSDGLVVYASSIDSGRWGDESGPLQVGSKVFPQQGLIVLPDTSEMMAYVKVHESLAGRVRKGMPCAVKIDAAGDARFTGRVDSVGVLAEQTSRWMDPTLREYTVKIALDTPSGESTQLRPSMRCEAEVTLGKVSDVLTVPIQAVHSEGLLRYVHVPTGSGLFARRPVMVGQRSDRFAEIKVGLQSGERVLLRKPDAGELVNRGQGWNPAELAAVGLEINSSGDIVPSAAAIAARQGGAEGRGGPGRRGGGSGGGSGGGQGRGPRDGGGDGGTGGGGGGGPARSAGEPAAPSSGSPSAAPSGSGDGSTAAPAAQTPAK
ncbi:MAG: HlyD family efflux transporter periplasmic adaptor subunit [Phycisphaerales bacterium]|nr:HlyD family efflux transporter periplasmic adaptor subunit [Phycisphaerales bacterium]